MFEPRYEGMLLIGLFCECASVFRLVQRLIYCAQ